MQLTPLRALVIGAVIGALGGWLIVVVAGAFDLVAPHVPWTTPIVLVLITALVGGIGFSTHQQLQVRRQRMPPERAVAFLVLGKASALAGAVVAGGYLTYALMFLARFDAEAPRERVVRSAIAALAGIALTIAGLRLERACKVPGADDDDSDDPRPDTDEGDQDYRRANIVAEGHQIPGQSTISL